MSRAKITDLYKLFGGSAFAKEYLFHLEDYNKASWFQNFIASIAGASASLVVSAPLDVIKTRIQNRNFDNPESGFRILANMAKNEGPSSFFKGLVPKVRRAELLKHNTRNRPPPLRPAFTRSRPVSTLKCQDANGSCAAAPHDWTQAGLLLLACPDLDSCL
jgi:hypothetical protein